MKDELKNWQQNWQQEKAPLPDSNTLLQMLNKMEARASRERVLILLAFVLTIGFLIWALPLFKSAYFITGFSLIALAMVILLVRLFMHKLKPANRIDLLDNKAFLQQQIKSLRWRMRTTAVYMWVYAFLLMAGINIVYFDALSDLSITGRLWAHGCASLFIIVIFVWGVRRRMKKYRQELLPLIEALEDMQQVAEE